MCVCMYMNFNIAQFGEGIAVKFESFDDKSYHFLRHATILPYI